MERSVEGESVDDSTDTVDREGMDPPAERAVTDSAVESGADSDESTRTFGRRGWVLVGAIVVSFFVIPGILVAYPNVGPVFGLGFQQTYLVLPLIPAVLLAFVAVWATAWP